MKQGDSEIASPCASVKFRAPFSSHHMILESCYALVLGKITDTQTPDKTCYMKKSNLICPLILLFLLNSCFMKTSSSPDYAQKANRDLRGYDLSKTVPTEEDLRTQRLLWKDDPTYHALAQDKRKVISTPRLVSAVTPSWPWFADGEARVVMSVIIGEDGNVEAAKILESSNSQFDKAALSAVKKWKYLPASTSTGPTRFAVNVPIVFKKR
jgi:TonB family protein